MNSQFPRLAVILGACTFVAWTCLQSVPLHASGTSEITIIVHQSEDHTHAVHGVIVSAVLDTGEIREIGRVEEGRVTFSKDRLQGLGTTLLLFHGGEFFPGAIRIYDPTVGFYEFNRYHIALAPFHIH